MKTDKIKLPRLAIVIGDPYGGNIELVLSTISDDTIKTAVELILVGDFEAILQKAEELQIPKTIKRVDLTSIEPKDNTILVIDKPKHPFTPQGSDLKQKAGERIVVDLETALQAAIMGYVDCITVAPVNMPALRAAGFAYSDLSALFREWIRLTDDFELMEMNDAPDVKIVTNLPFIATIASPKRKSNKKQGAAYLLHVMKETIVRAVELTTVNKKG